ncbi:MAG: serine acetyltransferase [Ferruginibacter sp.]
MVNDFLSYLFQKTYQSGFDIGLHQPFIDESFEAALTDFQYHYPQKTAVDLFNTIKFGTGWLNTFLYRFGNTVFKYDSQHCLLPEIHWLLKEVCSSEIYFSISIGKGLYIRHGEGLVIGSRCKIGEGFVIHQHCTIGHKVKLGDGPIIGDNVEMGVGSSVLGNCTIGSKVVIGAHSLVISSVPDNVKVAGIPAKIFSR